MNSVKSNKIGLVWDIKGLYHCVKKIWGLENLSLWQKLNSFVKFKGQYFTLYEGKAPK